MEDDMKVSKIITVVIAAVMMLGILPTATTAHAEPLDPTPFELPVAGATGWMASTYAQYQSLRSDPDVKADVILKLNPGEGFVILEEHGSWWKVRTGNGTKGWVQHIACFINLPDVLPSIVYLNTNAVSSVFKSSGYDIPDITGHKLYDAHSMNKRLGRVEFVMPALYASSLKLAEAQYAALADGNTIVMYEAFRPHDTQMSVGQNLRALVKSNQAVRNAINANGWSEGWFIAQSRSSHQRGSAFDVGLARIITSKTVNIGGYKYTSVTEYSLYEMPTDIHELSPAAALHFTPNGRARTLTDGAYRLQGYFADNGFSSITSEWWHFTDRAGQNSADNVGILGEFATGSTVYSTLPDGKGGDAIPWHWHWEQVCKCEVFVVPLKHYAIMPL